ncbi:hypothetical protein G6514_002747 [Epicoccum nigrum]|nr:hypothetical protein G6514_002747 [Epicoccum nigrum]
MAKKKKTKTGVVADANTSSQSRYTSPPVTLRIGPDCQPYYVPETLLQSLRDLPISESAERTIDLPDVDVETGHVIVHFLYTNQYQTLPDIEEEFGSSYSRVDFKKAISAFIAAKNYKLTVLKDLARDEVLKCGENIGITQAAHGIGKETLCALQDDAGWLQDFIVQKAEQAFANNDDIFSSNSFFSGIKSHKLAKILGKHVAKLYRSRVEQLSGGPSDLERSPNDQKVPPKNEYELRENVDVLSSMAPSKGVHADEQSGPSPPEVETPVDSWSFGLPKRQTAHIAEEGWSGTSWSTVPQVEPEPAVEVAIEPAVDTVLTEDAPPVTSDPVKETAEFTVDQADAKDPWAFLSIGASKKKKKKQKKTQLNLSAEEAPGTESETINAAENLPVTEPAFLERSSMDNAHGRQSEAPAEVVNGSTLDSIAPIEDSPVLVEPLPTHEQQDQWGIWGASASLSSSKKKKKKGKAAGNIEAPAPAPAPPAVTDIVATEDLIEPELPEVAPEAVSEAVSEVHEPESHTAKATCEETVPADMKSTDDNTCLSRYEHLTRDDQWRNCQQCKSYMLRIAMKVQQEKQMSMGW